MHKVKMKWNTSNLSLHSHPRLYSSYLESAFLFKLLKSLRSGKWVMRTKVEWVEKDKSMKTFLQIPCLLVEPKENFKGSNLNVLMCGMLGPFSI